MTTDFCATFETCEDCNALICSDHKQQNCPAAEYSSNRICLDEGQRGCNFTPKVQISHNVLCPNRAERSERLVREKEARTILLPQASQWKTLLKTANKKSNNCKVCQCEIPFSGKGRPQTTCDACKAKLTPQSKESQTLDIVCRHCEQLFTIVAKRGRRPVFCSDECREASLGSVKAAKSVNHCEKCKAVLPVRRGRKARFCDACKAEMLPSEIANTTNTCSECGVVLPVKRGRPAKMCVDCKTANVNNANIKVSAATHILCEICGQPSGSGNHKRCEKFERLLEKMHENVRQVQTHNPTADSLKAIQGEMFSLANLVSSKMRKRTEKLKSRKANQDTPQARQLTKAGICLLCGQALPDQTAGRPRKWHTECRNFEVDVNSIYNSLQKISFAKELKKMYKAEIFKISNLFNC